MGSFIYCGKVEVPMCNLCVARFQNHDTYSLLQQPVKLSLLDLIINFRQFTPSAQYPVSPQEKYRQPHQVDPIVTFLTVHPVVLYFSPYDPSSTLLNHSIALGTPATYSLK